jgi:TRAP-type mannitol/chloroaromatic compound transport system permease small subunit
VGEPTVKYLFLKAEKIIDKISNWGLLSSGIIILLMAFLTTYGVGRRYLLDNPEPYSYEISTIFLVACVLFALSAIQRAGRNLRVDFISNLTSPKWQGILMDIITPVLALVFVSIIVWKSWGIFLSAVETGEKSQSAWEEPLWPTKFLVPATMFWLCLTLLSQLAHGIINLVKGQARVDTRIDLTQ